MGFMGASTVKYALFFLVFCAIIGAEVVLNQQSVYDAFTVDGQATGGMVTGNAVNENADSDGGYFIPVLVVLFVVASLYVWLQRKKLWVVEHDGSDYARLILRVMLGIVFLIFGFEVTPTFVGYGIAMLKLIVGVLLIVGIFTRVVAYVGFFYFLSFLAGPFDLVMTVVFLGISLCVMFLGPGPYSIDNDLLEKHRRSKQRV